MQKNGIPLTTAQFSETLLPNRAELHFDFETLGKILTFRWLELSKVAREQLAENATEVTVK